MNGWIDKAYGVYTDANGTFQAAGGSYKAPKGITGYVWVNEGERHLVCQFRPGMMVYDKVAPKPAVEPVEVTEPTAATEDTAPKAPKARRKKAQ
jgi:hypothetical protein